MHHEFSVESPTDSSVRHVFAEEQPQNELVIRIQPNEAIYYKVGWVDLRFTKTTKIEKSPGFYMVLVWFGCFCFKVSAKNTGIPSRERFVHIIPPFTGSSENHRLKSAGWEKDMLVPGRVLVCVSTSGPPKRFFPSTKIWTKILLKLKPGQWNVRDQNLPETTHPSKSEWDLSNGFRGPSVSPVGDFLGGSSNLGGSFVDSLQLELMGTQPTRRVWPKLASSYRL